MVFLMKNKYQRMSKEEKKKLRFLIDDLNLEYHKILINELGIKDYVIIGQFDVLVKGSNK